jgi:hypothetical protein
MNETATNNLFRSHRTEILRPYSRAFVSGRIAIRPDERSCFSF